MGKLPFDESWHYLLISIAGGLVHFLITVYKDSQINNKLEKKAKSEAIGVPHIFRGLVFIFPISYLIRH